MLQRCCQNGSSIGCVSNYAEPKMGVNMRNLAKWFAATVVCFGFTQATWATDWSTPFVSLSVPKEPLALGEVGNWLDHKFGAHLVARVIANCPYHLSAGFQSLVHERSGIQVAPKDLSVTINGKQVPLGTARTSLVSSGKPTSVSGVDVPIDLEVRVAGLISYPAGRYRGTLVIAVMAGL